MKSLLFRATYMKSLLFRSTDHDLVLMHMAFIERVTRGMFRGPCPINALNNACLRAQSNLNILMSAGPKLAFSLEPSGTGLVQATVSPGAFCDAQWWPPCTRNNRHSTIKSNDKGHERTERTCWPAAVGFLGRPQWCPHVGVRGQASRGTTSGR